jgi:hypothetical protein
LLNTFSITKVPWEGMGPSLWFGFITCELVKNIWIKDFIPFYPDKTLCCVKNYIFLFHTKVELITFVELLSLLKGFLIYKDKLNISVAGERYESIVLLHFGLFFIVFHYPKLLFRY